MSKHVILMTDVEASTEMSERLGDSATAEFWLAHDRLARDLLREWKGREIDRSDGFLLLFASVGNALGYAAAYHRALGLLPAAPRARAGVHLGTLLERENTAADVALGAKRIEVDGVAKPTAARIMALAAGGQTLLSGEARAALEASNALVSTQSHGHWLLKGLQEPIELFEVEDAQAPCVPPSDTSKAWRVVRHDDLWLPRREVRHSLPAERDSFVGRERPLRELARRFEDGARLVSVVGPGGIGKTRLVQRYGWTWLGDFPGGVWFCDLAAARTLDGVLHSTAQGLGVPLAGIDPLALLGDAIGGRGRCLVILDNFEQLVRYARATVGRWLDRAIDARFVVTSREVLGIAGEQTMFVESLSPQEGAVLFGLRADAATRHAHTVEDRAAVAPLVELLDGLPLAIELAAVRVRLLPPQRLLARMGERFKLLTSTGGRPDRQATMRATLDWSWELLSSVERSALVQISVFEGGFSLAAAEDVVAQEAIEESIWVPDVVQALVDKSLVRRVDRDRFTLLNSVHDYVTKRTSEGNDDAAMQRDRTAAEARHARYFARLSEAAAMEDNTVDIENVVVASRRAISMGDATSAIATLDGAWSLLKRTGPFRVALDLARKARESLSLDGHEAAMVSLVEGSALFMQGRNADAAGVLEAGVDFARGWPRTEAMLLCALGEVDAATGQFERARMRLNAALGLARSMNDPRLQCWALNALGSLCAGPAELEEASSCFSAALELARTAKDTRWQGGLLGNLGSLHYRTGRMDLAAASYREALALTAESNDQRWEGNTRCNLGLTLHEMGQSDEAHALLESALEIARHLGSAHLECSVLCNLGIVADGMLSSETARKRFEEANKIARRLEDASLQVQILCFLGVTHAKLHSFETARECLMHAGNIPDSATNLALRGLLLCSLAEVEYLAGREDPFLGHLAEARRVASATDLLDASDLLRRIDRLCAMPPRTPLVAPVDHDRV